MNNEVIVQDDSITRLLPGDLMSYDDSVRVALQERADEAKGDKPKDEGDVTSGPNQDSPDQDSADQDSAAR
jgi:hypothetical protein